MNPSFRSALPPTSVERAVAPSIKSAIIRTNITAVTIPAVTEPPEQRHVGHNIARGSGWRSPLRRGFERCSQTRIIRNNKGLGDCFLIELSLDVLQILCPCSGALYGSKKQKPVKDVLITRGCHLTPPI